MFHRWIQRRLRGKGVCISYIQHFAQTINRLKGKVTMIFITHQVPKGLQVDEVVNMGQHAMHMSLVKDEI